RSQAHRASSASDQEARSAGPGTRSVRLAIFPQSRNDKTNRSGQSRAGALGEVRHVGRLAGLVAGRLGLVPSKKNSETIQDLVGPEPLEAVQRLVERGELLARDAADLLHR